MAESGRWRTSVRYSVGVPKRRWRVTGASEPGARLGSVTGGGTDSPSAAGGAAASSVAGGAGSPAKRCSRNRRNASHFVPMAGEDWETSFGAKVSFAVRRRYTNVRLLTTAPIMRSCLVA